MVLPNGPIIHGRRIPDDTIFALGSDGDQVLLNRSTALTANTALTDVLLGTSDRQALEENSLILSNVTANGDFGGYVNNGGISKEWLRVDASALQISLGHGDFTVGLSGASIAHGLTSVAPTNVYGKLFPVGTLLGGFAINAVGMTLTNTPFYVSSYSRDNADTTKTTAGVGLMMFRGGQHDGANALSNVVADGNLLVIQGRVAGAWTSRFIHDIEGSAHADVEWVAFAAHDDLALIADIEAHLLTQESPMGTYSRHMLEAVGIIGKDSWHMEKGKPRAMVNFTKLAMLHHGALMQVGDRLRQLEQALLGAGIPLPQLEAKA